MRYLICFSSIVKPLSNPFLKQTSTQQFMMNEGTSRDKPRYEHGCTYSSILSVSKTL